MSFDIATYLADPEDLALRTGVDAANTLLLLRLRQATNRFRTAVGYPVSLQVDDVYFISGRGGSALLLPGRPIVGDPVVEVDGTAVTDFQVGRRSGTLRSDAGWADGLENIKVTYTHGYLDIPEDIQEAVLDVASLVMGGLIAGVESITTGDESVKFTSGTAASGVTQTWVDAVSRHANGTGEDT